MAGLGTLVNQTGKHYTIFTTEQEAKSFNGCHRGSNYTYEYKPITVYGCFRVYKKGKK
jgi:hypothetical protein